METPDNTGWGQVFPPASHNVLPQSRVLGTKSQNPTKGNCHCGRSETNPLIEVLHIYQEIASLQPFSLPWGSQWRVVFEGIASVAALFYNDSLCFGDLLSNYINYLFCTLKSCFYLFHIFILCFFICSLYYFIAICKQSYKFIANKINLKPPKKNTKK